jgi:hypothetical protein
VNDCVALGTTPLLAVIVSEYDPPVPAAGVPLSVAVPLPWSMNVTPAGNTPASVIGATVGNPVVVTVNVPALPTAKVVVLALVIAGAWPTVSVKTCVAFGSTPLLAVIVSKYEPPLAAPGVPLRVAVPLPLSVKVTPVGSAPFSVTVPTTGDPLIVTVNVPALPTVNVAVLPLVIAGA